MINMMEKIKKIVQDLILPELEIIKGENKELKTILELTNKRLDDINAHLVDQSRRIDDLRIELKEEIRATNKRIDDLRIELKEEIRATNKRIDDLRVELKGEISATNKRIDDLRIELRDEIAKTNNMIDDNNTRMDRLYEVVVRRDEHEKLEQRVSQMQVRLAA